MLTKVIICKIDNMVYTNAYNIDGKLEYYLQDLVEPCLESIYLAKITSINKRNRLAFIDYLNNKVGVINLPIENKLQTGSKILCQMRWRADNNKHAKFSSEVKLIGKYVILTNEQHHHYSKTLNRREDLKELSGKFKDYGIIFRSAINDLKDISVIEDEILSLIIKQNKIYKLSNSSEKLLLMQGVGNYIQLLRDSSLSKDCTIIVNDEEIFQIVRQYLNLWLIHEVILDPQAKIIDTLKTLGDVIKINNGSLVFHKLSGINLIDINSYSSKLNFYQVNYLAIDEIVKLIKLYDLNGIILIDFIKNMSIQQQKNLVDNLTAKFIEDWRHVRILGFTKSGICEIIRNK